MLHETTPRIIVLCNQSGHVPGLVKDDKMRTPESVKPTRTPEVVKSTASKQAPTPTTVITPTITREPSRTVDPEWKTYQDNLLYRVNGTVIEFRIDTARTLYNTEKSYVIASSHGCTGVDELPGVKVNLTIFEPIRK